MSTSLTTLAVTLVLAASLLPSVAAFAAPNYGNAVAETARSGQITPHGVWDSHGGR